MWLLQSEPVDFRNIAEPPLCVWRTLQCNHILVWLISPAICFHAIHFNLFFVSIRFRVFSRCVACDCRHIISPKLKRISIIETKRKNCETIYCRVQLYSQKPMERKQYLRHEGMGCYYFSLFSLSSLRKVRRCGWFWINENCTSRRWESKLKCKTVCTLMVWRDNRERRTTDNSCHILDESTTPLREIPIVVDWPRSSESCILRSPNLFCDCPFMVAAFFSPTLTDNARNDYVFVCLSATKDYFKTKCRIRMCPDWTNNAKRKPLAIQCCCWVSLATAERTPWNHTSFNI